jgi:heme-degrading monooxygenase HmoA
MYGTVYRARVTPGQEQAADELLQVWLRERAPKVDGFVRHYLIKSANHPGEWLGLVIFESEASYRKNAGDPEQDRWYRRFRAVLEADPDWYDGEITVAESGAVAL